MFQIREQLDAGSIQLEKGLQRTLKDSGEDINSLVSNHRLEFQQCIDGFSGDQTGQFFSSRINKVSDAMLSATDVNMYTHGDPLVENIMLKRDADGRVVQVAFVDFPNVKQQSPLFDLFSFLSTSLSGDIPRSIITAIEKDYKQRLGEHLPLEEFAREESSMALSFSREDVFKARCKTLLYFMNDFAWGAGVDEDLQVRRERNFICVEKIIKKMETDRRPPEFSS